MTRDELLELKPGRELDALVAEKVMGWSWGIIGDLGGRRARTLLAEIGVTVE